MAFRYIRRHLGVKSKDAAAEQLVVKRLAEAMEATPGLDASVILAFDAIHDLDGNIQLDKTHLYVKNEFAHAVVKGNRKMLLGASVHPYRKDAVEEIYKWNEAGAVLLKWLPLVQGFNPSDKRCLKVYDALAKLKLPLLAHTGGEKSLPVVMPEVASPDLLLPALERGVTVIAAHCGTRSAFGETDYVDTTLRLVREHKNLYIDTAALFLPTRWHAWKKIMADPVAVSRLIHGSDWPIPAYPHPGLFGVGESLGVIRREKSWFSRDVAMKKMLGLGDDYFGRLWTLLTEEQKGRAVKLMGSGVKG
jgi:uncharacterized protein